MKYPNSRDKCHSQALIGLIGISLLTLLLAAITLAIIASTQARSRSVILSPRLADRVLEQPTTRVLIRLNTPFAPESDLRPGGVIVQRNAIRYVQERIVTVLDAVPDTQVIHRYTSTPLLVAQITVESLSALQKLPGFVVRIDEQCAYLDAALCD